MRLLILLCCWPLTASATKPCPEDPCADLTQCAALAKWVVVAHVVSVEHHVQGEPLFKDFAKFTVHVEKWEKGKATVETLQFQVGWCNNSMPPPPTKKARVRIYGDGDPLAKQPQYLHLEELK